MTQSAMDQYMRAYGYDRRVQPEETKRDNPSSTPARPSSDGCLIEPCVASNWSVPTATDELGRPAPQNCHPSSACENCRECLAPADAATSMCRRRQASLRDRRE